MNNLEFENMIFGTNKKEESIMEQPVWDVRCWLEGLNQGEYLKVNKDGQVFTDADGLFIELVAHGDYERSIEDGNILTVVYQNGDTIKLEAVNKNVLEEAKRDFEIERTKNATIEGYGKIRRLLNLIPRKYENLVYLDVKDNSLWFDSCRLGKISEIAYIEENYHLDMGLDTEIIIERAKEEPIRIEFKHGKNEKIKKYDYIDFSIAVGY